MLRGYVSSDEDDYDDYDFGYSEALVFYKKPSSPTSLLPEIHSEKFRKELHSALEKSQQIELFLKAVSDGDLFVLEELIELGVSPDCSDSQGWTSLMKACGAGKPDVVEFLLQHGANPNLHRELFTPLMTCCTYTLLMEDLKLNCASLLLDCGAEVNAKDKHQTTALMYASGSGYKSIVARLLEVTDIKVNLKDKEGWTALFYAVNQNNIDIAQILISAETDLSIKDKYNRTAIHLALDRDFQVMAKTLGYIEEKPAELMYKKSLKNKFLDELPDSKGKGGFSSDAKEILDAFNQSDVKKISLPDLLNATDNDLYEIGVKLKPDREMILASGIHRYHLHSWSDHSKIEIVKGVPMTLEDAIAITGNLARNLTIINASVRYLDTRISSRKDTESVDIATEKKLIITLVDAYILNERVKVLLTRINLAIQKIKLKTSGDFIYPYKKKCFVRKFVTFFWWTTAAATAGFLIYNYKSSPNFKILHSFLLYLPFWFKQKNLFFNNETLGLWEEIPYFGDQYLKSYPWAFDLLY